MDPFVFLWGPGASVVSADAPRIQPGAQGLAFWFGTLLRRQTSCRPSKAFLSPAPLLVAQLTCDKSGPESFGPNVGFAVAPFKPPFCCFLGVFGSWPHPFRLTCDCPICLLFEDHLKGAVAVRNRAKNGCASLEDFAAAAVGCSPPASAFSAKKTKNQNKTWAVLFEGPPLLPGFKRETNQLGGPTLRPTPMARLCMVSCSAGGLGDMGVGQNETGKPPVLVMGSIYQGA